MAKKVLLLQTFKTIAARYIAQFLVCTIVYTLCIGGIAQFIGDLFWTAAGYTLACCVVAGVFGVLFATLTSRSGTIDSSRH